MAVVVTVAPVTQQTWPQGDIRDPLGIWGFRVLATGDASGGSIKCFVEVPNDLRAAYVYTVYDINWALLTGAFGVSQHVKIRLLSNWPNIDPIPGVQAYGSYSLVDVVADAQLTAPLGGLAPTSSIIGSTQRFILLYDPRPGATGDMAILEVELSENPDPSTHSIEGYGYYWDRSVMQAPGGPRHPGSS